MDVLRRAVAAVVTFFRDPLLQGIATILALLVILLGNSPWLRVAAVVVFLLIVIFAYGGRLLPVVFVGLRNLIGWLGNLHRGVVLLVGIILGASLVLVSLLLTSLPATPLPMPSKTQTPASTLPFPDESTTPIPTPTLTPTVTTTLTSMHTPSNTISALISTAFAEIDAEAYGEMGSFYVHDNNSRRVFMKFVQETEAYPQEDVIKALVGFLEADEAITRWKAMRFLIYLKYRDSQVIRDFWYHESGWIYRQIVLEAADNLPIGEAVQLLVDVAKFDDNDHNRSAALNKLGNYVNIDTRQQIVSAYLDSLSDVGSWSRRAALEQLLRLKATEALPDVPSMLLSDEDSWVRIAANEYLAELGSLESYEDVISAYARGQINQSVFVRATEKYIERFGEEAVTTKISNISDVNEREKIEEALRE